VIRSFDARGTCALLLTLLFSPAANAQSDAAAPPEPASFEASAATPIPASASFQASTASVERLHAALIDVMKRAEALGYEGRRERLAPDVVETFDLDFMAQKSVGRYWKQASEEERGTLVDTFSRYTVANYAGRFDGYSGQHFETLGVEPSARDTVLVRTKLHNPDGDDVNLDYRLRQVDDSWRIIDIYFNGTVSELALRRSEYSSLIKREGFQALLTALDDRIETLAQTPSDSAS